MATDNKDPKEIAKYEKIIEGTKGQLADAQAGRNLTKPDKEIIVREADLERVDETKDFNFANLFGETDADEESEEDQDKDEMEKEEAEEEAESGEEEEEDDDEDEDDEDGKVRKKKVVKAAAPEQVEIKDVAKQIPGKFAAKTRVKYLKIAYKAFKADYKKQRKVKASKKKQKNKYRIKGYRIKYSAKVQRKCKEELKIAKAVYKAEKKLESRRKALDGAISSGKEKSIWKAKKNMLNYRG